MRMYSRLAFGPCGSVSVRVGLCRFTHQPREEGFCRPVGAWRIWVSGCRGMNPPAEVCRPVGAEHIRVFPTSLEGAEENSPGWNPRRGCSPGNHDQYHVFKPRRGGRKQHWSHPRAKVRGMQMCATTPKPMPLSGRGCRGTPLPTVRYYERRKRSLIFCV